MQIERVSAAQAREHLPALIELLQDAVASGASIGFLPPLTVEQATEYWRATIDELEGGQRVMLAAFVENQLAGAVQLALATKANAQHRAEVQRLLVHRRFRRQGLGTALMQAVERTAQELGRALLVLDTRQGDPSERLYQKLGYIESGAIPHYARSANGELHTTVFFYRLLTQPK